MCDESVDLFQNQTKCKEAKQLGHRKMTLNDSGEAEHIATGKYLAIHNSCLLDAQLL